MLQFPVQYNNKTIYVPINNGDTVFEFKRQLFEKIKEQLAAARDSRDTSSKDRAAAVASLAALVSPHQLVLIVNGVQPDGQITVTQMLAAHGQGTTLHALIRQTEVGHAEAISSLLVELAAITAVEPQQALAALIEKYKLLGMSALYRIFADARASKALQALFGYVAAQGEAVSQELNDAFFTHTYWLTKALFPTKAQQHEFQCPPTLALTSVDEKLALLTLMVRVCPSLASYPKNAAQLREVLEWFRTNREDNPARRAEMSVLSHYLVSNTLQNPDLTLQNKLALAFLIAKQPYLPLPGATDNPAVFSSIFTAGDFIEMLSAPETLFQRGDDPSLNTLNLDEIFKSTLSDEFISAVLPVLADENFSTSLNTHLGDANARWDVFPTLLMRAIYRGWDEQIIFKLIEALPPEALSVCTTDDESVLDIAATSNRGPVFFHKLCATLYGRNPAVFTKKLKSPHEHSPIYNYYALKGQGIAPSLVPTYAENSQLGVAIRVSGMERQFVFNFKPGTTVAALKQLIVETICKSSVFAHEEAYLRTYPLSALRLVFGGHAADDALALQYQDVVAGTVVHCLVTVDRVRATADTELLKNKLIELVQRVNSMEYAHNIHSGQSALNYAATKAIFEGLPAAGYGEVFRFLAKTGASYTMWHFLRYLTEKGIRLSVDANDALLLKLFSLQDNVLFGEGRYQVPIQDSAKLTEPQACCELMKLLFKSCDLTTDGQLVNASLIATIANEWPNRPPLRDALKRQATNIMIDEDQAVASQRDSGVAQPAVQKIEWTTLTDDQRATISAHTKAARDLSPNAQGKTPRPGDYWDSLSRHEQETLVGRLAEINDEQNAKVSSLVAAIDREQELLSAAARSSSASVTTRVITPSAQPTPSAANRALPNPPVTMEIITHFLQGKIQELEALKADKQQKRKAQQDSTPSFWRSLLPIAVKSDAKWGEEISAIETFIQVLTSIKNDHQITQPGEKVGEIEINFANFKLNNQASISKHNSLGSSLIETFMAKFILELAALRQRIGEVAITPRSLPSLSPVV